MTPIESLLHWVREREAIRIRKESGAPQPWTEDPILAKYRFCNVRREDDRVTVWVRKHIREPFADHPDLWFMLAIARWINWPATLEQMIARREDCWPSERGFHPEKIAWALKEREKLGQKVFTGAYTINAPSKKGASKIDYVANEVLGKPWQQRDYIGKLLDNGPTIKRAHECLTNYKGWGNFMAYQVCVDLRFTRYLRDASDVSTWAAAGPGTISGLNRVHGRPTDKALDQRNARSEMRWLFDRVICETGVAIDFSDIPNILCETDKYLRVKTGEGEPRALYRPTNEPMP